jgi:hypothetical protein
MSTGLQTIIDNCNGIKFNRRNVVGIQYTRNEIPRVSATPTRNPWKITLDMPNSFKYNQARALMEELDTLDTTTPQIITFGNNINLQWIFAYQGTMTTAMINTIRVDTYVGETLTLKNLPVVPSTRVLFKKNDLIQIAGYPYPFTSTTDVLRGTGSTVTVTTSRPNIITNSVSNLGIVVGSTCEFNMFCPNMPVYKLIVGGYERIGNGPIQNNALLQFSDSFYLYEFVGDS